MPVTILKPHIVYKAMPYREEWRINGKLSLASQEALVDYFDDTTDIFGEEDSCLVHSYEASIEELASTLVEEDFLTDAKGLASDLVKRVKGANKDLAKELFDIIDQLETELQQANEYAMEQIKELRKGVQASKNIAGRFDL